MTILGLTTSEWTEIALSALIVVVAALVGRLLVSLLLDQGARRLAKRTSTTLDDAILRAVRPPLVWLIAVLALRIAIARLTFLPASWRSPLSDLFFVLYLLLAFVFAWRLLSNLFTWYGREMARRTETPLDEQLMPFFRRVALVLLSVLVFITLLSHFQVDVTAFVTTLGIGSLAIALAAQAALEDIISGFLVMVDRPYRIGDRIEVLELNTWGDVVDIGLRSTRIRTRDNRMVIVPNSIIGKSLIVNHAYPNTQYRIQVEVGVAYGTDIELARRTLIEAVRGVKGVLPNRPVEALFLQFGDSALIFRVRWWIESYEDTRRMFDRVNTAIYKALNEAGIAIPFPQRDVHHKVDPEDVDRIARLFHPRGEGP